MNIQGKLNYSSASRGLRQRDVISDQQFKLVFIYPFIVDDSLSNYNDLIRKFFTASILKELFIDNALNIVGLASQVPSIEDDDDAELDTNQAINIATFRNPDGSINMNVVKRKFENLKIAKPDLERKIKKNTAIIKQLITSDSRFTKLKPQVELITLNNLIEVPVIVGTDNNIFPNTFLTAVIFYSALGDEKGNPIRLDSPGNLDKIFKEIEKLDPFKTQIQFTSISDSLPTNIAGKFINKLPVFGRLYRKIKQHNVRKQIKKEQEINDRWNNSNKDVIDYDSSLFILNGIKNDVAINKNQLSKLLDKSHLMQKYKYYGYSGNSNDVISKIIAKNNNTLTNIKHKSRIHFHNLFQVYSNNIILSIAHLFRNIDKYDLDLNKVISDNFYGSFADNVDDLLDQVFENFNDRVLGSNRDAEDLADRMNIIGREILAIFRTFFDEFTNRFTQNDTLPVMFNMDHYTTFFNAIHKLSDRANKLYESSLTIINRVFPELDFKNSINTTFSNYLDSAISNFLRQILDPSSNNIMNSYGYRYQSSAIFQNNIIPMSQIFRRDPNNQNNQIAVPGQYDMSNNAIKLFNETVTQFTDAYKKIIATMFIYSIVSGLCEYIDILKVDIKVGKMDVLDDHNYVLVIPSVSVMTLATIINAKNYQKLVENIKKNIELKKQQQKEKHKTSDEIEQFKNIDSNVPNNIIQINTNYFKGIVKFISGKLNVPNLFIVDTRDKTIYYKLMYQTDVQSMKENNMSTYVDTLMKMTEEQESNQNNLSYF
jgi:hypothetical protein